MTGNITRHSALAVMTLAVGLLPAWLPGQALAGYMETDLVSDLPGLAPVTDPNLVNPWGLASSSSSPIWVSDNGQGVSTLYNGAGQPFPVGSPLVVAIPPPSGSTVGTTAAPTGVVFNGNSSSFGGARFIFATENGTIATWSAGTSATIAADNSGSGAVYKGLAIGHSVSQGDLLYATNFHAGKVDVFTTGVSGLTQVTVPGGFVDPSLPAGFAPFGIQNIGGKIYVTFAKQDGSGKDDVAGAGNGFVDVFDTDGSLITRLVTNGPLNSPWGLALAPAGFGPLGGDLLVGNFGDGVINAFNAATGALLGQLDDPTGNPIVIDGLWGLLFGNGGNGGLPNELFFSAGIPGPGGAIEDHGLFGKLTPAPEPSTLALLAVGLAVLGVWQRTRRGRRARSAVDLGA